MIIFLLILAEKKKPWYSKYRKKVRNPTLKPAATIVAYFAVFRYLTIDINRTELANIRKALSKELRSLHRYA